MKPPNAGRPVRRRDFRGRAARCVAAFTLVELLITLAIAALLLTFGIPALNKLIARSKLEGQARMLSVLVGRARNEAVTLGVETVVHFDGDAFVAFADLDGAGSSDPPDGEFNPVSGSPHRTTDWRLDRQSLDSVVTIAGPSGQPAVAGLVNPDRPDGRIIFNPDGSLFSTGGIRLSDPRGNHVEVAVGPRATGQVTLLKWDGTAWREQGEQGVSWQWN
jgi:prepilin-type N-terminal cleavage/methylation domain-containing protein